MNYSIKILFTPLNAPEQIGTSIGLARALKDRGHQVKYVVDKAQEHLLHTYGFGIEALVNPKWPDPDPDHPGQWQEKMFDEIPVERIVAEQSPLKGFLISLSIGIKLCYKYSHNFFFKDKAMARIIREYNPDIIVVDDIVCYPSVIYANKPWVYMRSTNPTSLYQESIGPKEFWVELLLKSFLIYKTVDTNSRRRVFWRLCKFYSFLLSPIYKVLYLSRGYGLKWNTSSTLHSPYLNLYVYPKELDYSPKEKLYKNSFRIDTTITVSDDESIELGHELREFLDDVGDSKLIYVSIDSFISRETVFKKHLLKILSLSKHKYLISSGVDSTGRAYPSSSNVRFIDRKVPRRKLLPLVDLVLTHGDNDMVVESFTYGKPLIVIPIWFNQMDNGLRVQELGYGLCLDYDTNVLKEKLLVAIEKMIDHDQLHQRMSIASKRITSSDTMTVAVKMVENLIKNHNKPKTDPSPKEGIVWRSVKIIAMLIFKRMYKVVF